MGGGGRGGVYVLHSADAGGKGGSVPTVCYLHHVHTALLDSGQYNVSLPSDGGQEGSLYPSTLSLDEQILPGHFPHRPVIHQEESVHGGSIGGIYRGYNGQSVPDEQYMFIVGLEGGIFVPFTVLDAHTNCRDDQTDVHR